MSKITLADAEGALVVAHNRIKCLAGLGMAAAAGDAIALSEDVWVSLCELIEREVKAAEVAGAALVLATRRADHATSS